MGTPSVLPTVVPPALCWLQDTRLKWKGSVGKADLTVKQLVPGGKWALVPNPGESRRPCCHAAVGRGSRASCAAVG